MIPVLADLHNHSAMCDGHSSIEEMVEAALAKGFADFGISAHGYTPFDLAASVKDEDEYISAMRELQELYADRIRLYCGVEEDFHAPLSDRSRYDYVIGSVHYFYDDDYGRYFAIDGAATEFADCIDQLFAGDPCRMIKKYYQNVVENIYQSKPMIIGHFDLIVKNNQDDRFFDEEDKRYQNAAKEALVACLETDSLIELNTGAVFRGYRKTVYPAQFLLKEMKERKALITLSADAHTTAAVGFAFDQALLLLRDSGFRSVLVYQDGKYVEQGIE